MAIMSLGLRSGLLILGFGIANLLLLFSVNWEYFPTVTMFGIDISTIAIGTILIALNIIAYSSIDLAILGR